jgi:acyl-CoA hydrolase
MYEYRAPAVPATQEPRPASASRITLSRIMSPLNTNLHGNVHGGAILHFIDDVGGAVAARHSGGRAVTATMDEMSFLTPVHIGDLVHAHASVNWAGRSSMEVGVRVTAERWDVAGGEPRHVASAYLFYVGLDEQGRPREVPELVVETDVDRQRFREAEIRRSSRLARRQEITRSREPHEPGPR